MINLLQPTQGGSAEKFFGIFIVFIIVGLLAFLQYKKCDNIIKSRFSNGLIITYSTVSILASLFSVLGSYIILTTEPNIGLIVVAVFMVIIPSIGAIYTAFVPLLALIKNFLREVRLNLVAIILVCLAIMSTITSVVMIFVVF